jgi:transposase-like protein
LKFGSKIAANLRRRKAPASPRWHLDEMINMIAGERAWSRVQQLFDRGVEGVEVGMENHRHAHV